MGSDCGSLKRKRDNNESLDNIADNSEGKRDDEVEAQTVKLGSKSQQKFDEKLNAKMRSQTYELDRNDENSKVGSLSTTTASLPGCVSFE